VRATIRVAFVSTVLAAVLAAQSPQPQPQTGTLTGTVRNVSGALLQNVAVNARGPVPLFTQFNASTDSRGAFSIRNVPQGMYRVEFVLNGFVTHAREDVAVTAGGAVTLSVQMRAGSMASVDVVSQRSIEDQSAKDSLARRTPPAVPLPPPQAQAAPSPPIRTGTGSGIGSGQGTGAGAGVAGGVPGGVAGGAVYSGGGQYRPPPAYESGIGVVPRGDTASYGSIVENPFQRVTIDPVSTFSIDTDTASYANVRRFLNEGKLPPADAVRIEELVNYFRFDYPQPGNDAPFSITTELAEAPWNPKHRIALIGLQGQALAERDIAARNLVFLLDVSGSMAPADRLPLIRNAMRMLVDILRPADRVAIVVYAGSSGVALPSTTGDRKIEIHDAIERLQAAGSTNGASGLRLAYQTARDHFVKGGINRVILATDGDFNVGVTSNDELLRLIEEERKTGIFLSVLGVGRDNLQDDRMEMLADKGNGNYSYLDSLHEARKVLVHEAGATLVTIAKDVKIQVEFNPRTVSAYRLIGYENRLLRREDFNDDRKDAGEIGSGHSVTALYEIVPAGVELEPAVEPLKYQREVPLAPTAAAASDELLTVKLRYKAPDGDTSRLLTRVVRPQVGAMSANLGFASAVAEFGLLLRESPNRGASSFESLMVRARKFRGDDADGYRAEFVRLAELAASLRSLTASARTQ
jgi:Ca-activated chloride channel family protein